MTEKSLINLSLELVELDLDAEENKALVEKLFNELSTKVDSYVVVKQFAESQMERFKKEKEFMCAQQKKYERLVEHLETRAMIALNLLGVPKLMSDTGHSIAKRTSESVEITNLELIPDQYLREKVIVEPDKKAIMDALKLGNEVPGASIKKNEYVRIK